MRVAVVVAAMLFCAPVFAQGVKLPSVTNSIGMELIEIPAGKFMMGDGAGVAVTLTKSFGLGKYEVTQEQWKSVMGTEPWKGERFVKADKDYPASFVSWDDATKFCQKLTEIERKSGKLKADEEYRLPTEAEWEYACRAGTETAYSFGDDESKLGEYAWFEDNAMNAGEKYAHKVGMKKPNPWGLHDMHGNVWEWCSDWYGIALSGGTDPIGHKEGSGRGLRGGSWRDSPAGDCRSAIRDGIAPSFRYDHLGFRVARSQSETVVVAVADRRQQGAQAEPAPQVAVEARPGMEKPKPVEKVSKPGQTITNSIGMELIEIPAGKFMMGYDARYSHVGVAVTLTKPFGLGKTEVTQGQWKKVVGSEPWNGQKHVQADKDYPATVVSLKDATRFCEKLTDLEHKSGKLKANEKYRLPTEAEWEYACRAGTTTAYSFGDDEKQLGEYAWFEDNTRSEEDAHKVGLKKPNPWGLHDMHGNVWEWCSDYAVGENREFSGGRWRNLSVARGGNFFHGTETQKPTSRDSHGPSYRGYDLGFRVARSQSETVVVAVADRRQQGAQVVVETRPGMQKTGPVGQVFKPGQTITNSIGIELIEIPAGKFTMGSPVDEKDRREDEVQVSVTLTKPFGLGKYEVNQGQWSKVMARRPIDEVLLPHIKPWKDCPAAYVDWDEATEFCKKLTAIERKAGKLKANEEYRLPTEAEWEYACRAGTTTAFSFGDDEKQLGEYAWWGGLDLEAAKKKGVDEQGPGNLGIGEFHPIEVGKKKPNPWGLHDMHGNVFEWCSDWYGEGLSGGVDPVGPNGGSDRVNRGGNWRSTPKGCRSAIRNGNGPDLQFDGLGFRVARSQSVK